MNVAIQLSNKLISVVLVIAALGYYIPVTIGSTGLLDSGVVSGYFYWIALVNLFLIISAGISTLAFRTKDSLKKSILLLINNLVGLTGMILWYPFVSSS